MTIRIHPLAGKWHRIALAASMLFLFVENQPSLAAACARTGQEQQPEANSELTARVAALLGSTSLLDRAWGAYLAQKNGLKQFTPNLIDALRTLAEDQSPDAWLATSAVIDSLVQLEADVPASVVMSLKPRFMPHKVILLAKDPINNKDALLALMRNSTGKTWLAAGNLLAEARTAGLAALLLGRLQISVSIAVVDPSTGHFGGTVGGGYAGDGFIGVPNGYPPIGFYGLSEYPRRGYVVLAPGPTTIYYYRVVVNSGAQTGWGDSGRIVDYNHAVTEYLALLLNIRTDQLGLKSAESYSEEWKGAAALNRRLSQIRAELTAKYQSIASRLVDAGLLTEAESGELAPKIELHLRDCRSDKSIPLPDQSH